ncbi:MAG TPA: tRNA preQ1(34) S-adenosylmethionine ribosyltransferase-isomerase QueA, partial [Acidimicrobiales bacterium]|nr:tRNA preQ1(34) S-adenosylmethionine ribosyltransferase-isomerase QueA [Acidimicrobiales bacterium]
MDAFDYALDESSIAQRPVEPRSSSRLLVHLEVGSEPLDATVAELPQFLRPGDLLVVNRTRVIPARLLLEKESGGRVEVLLLERNIGEPSDETIGPKDTSEPASECEWVALVRPGRRVPPGTKLWYGDRHAVTVGAELPERDGRRFVEVIGPDVIDLAGSVPLPPYIKSPLEDPERYQTVYGSSPGSVAAPTAGLHLTHEVLDACKLAGAALATVDLVVGLDTFRPITADKPEDHQMHTERYAVPEATMLACEQSERVVAVGTTTVRALESVASTGILSGRTDLFIRADYPFRLVDVMLTNFHLPRSSLLLLVDSFYGPGWRDLYGLGARRGYRFLSFGDAMLI